MEPLVSVIMPAYNCEQYIEQAISSILRQTYKNFELLICDDASSDSTYEKILRHAKADIRIRVYRNEHNLKLLKVRNFLLSVAKGDLIAFQDADDYSGEARLEIMVAEFNANSSLGLLASQVGYVDKNGVIIRISEKPTSYSEVLDKIYRSNVVGGSIMMIRRSALSSVGGQFREYFDGLSYQDYDLSFLVVEKWVAYAIPEVLYFYRQHAASTSKRISVERYLAKDIVIYLANQRRQFGADDLMSGQIEQLDLYFAKLRQPFLADPSLIYRIYAASFMYGQLYFLAISTAFLAIRVQPFRPLNWRTLQYCIRIFFMKKISLLLCC